MNVFIDTYTSPCVASDQYAMPCHAITEPVTLDASTAVIAAFACCLACRRLKR